MSIEYTYKVVSIDEETDNMVVEYTATGYLTQVVNVRLPILNVETLDDVVSIHSPYTAWSTPRPETYVPEIGATGTLQTPAAASLPIDVLRFDAYVTESDPIFFKVQRGEATFQEWQDKVAEIKARHPNPTV